MAIRRPAKRRLRGPVLVGLLATLFLGFFLLATQFKSTWVFTASVVQVRWRCAIQGGGCRCRHCRLPAATPR